MKTDRERLKTYLIESFTNLCCSEIKFKDKLKIEGLFGVTVDEVDVFLVSFNETFINGTQSITATVHGSEYFGEELVKNQQISHLPGINQHLSGINDNGMVMSSKKQKLDFNELQNVSQFLNNNNNQSVQVSNSHDMDGIIICDGDSLTQTDVDNSANITDLSQNDSNNNWNFNFSKVLPIQQKHNISLDNEKVMAATLATIRQQQSQQDQQNLITINNVAALQHQLRQSYLTIQQQQDDNSNNIEQISFDNNSHLEQSVAVASAALQQQFAINLADQSGIGLNKALVSGLLLDQISQNCSVDGDNNSINDAQRQEAINQVKHLLSQNDDDSSIDNKKNATILQAFSTTNLQNNNNNEGNMKSNDELIKDGDEVGGDEADSDSKIWLSNNAVVSTAPPIYNNISTSHSLNTTSSSPSWQSAKSKTADSENMTTSILDNNNSNLSNQFMVRPVYSSSEQSQAFNLSDLMQQEQLFQQQQQQSSNKQQRQQSRGRKESRRSWTSNNKPNSCPYAGCTKTYFFTHDLKRHLRQKHGEVVVGDGLTSNNLYNNVSVDRNAIRQQQQQQQLQQIQAQLMLGDRKDFVFLVQNLNTKAEIEDDDNILTNNNCDTTVNNNDNNQNNNNNNATGLNLNNNKNINIDNSNNIISLMNDKSNDEKPPT